MDPYDEMFQVQLARHGVWLDIGRLRPPGEMRVYDEEFDEQEELFRESSADECFDIGYGQGMEDPCPIIISPAPILTNEKRLEWYRGYIQGAAERNGTRPGKGRDYRFTATGNVLVTLEGGKS